MLICEEPENAQDSGSWACCPFRLLYPRSGTQHLLCCCCCYCCFYALRNTSGCHTVPLLKRPSSIFGGGVVLGRRKKLMVSTGDLFLVGEIGFALFSLSRRFF